MTWSGSFAFGTSVAVFHGHAASNSLHAHASIQLAVARLGDVTIGDASGNAITAPGLLTRPGQQHVLRPVEDVTLIFIEPHVPLASALLDQTAEGGTAPLSAALTQAIRAAGSVHACLALLFELAPVKTAVLDARIVQALNWLVTSTQSDAIARAAAMCGLSDSRLRALARQHLGISLSQWLTWRKLELAGKALMTGSSLADAAFTAGFADQAHFSRTMRKVFGITPKSAAQVLRTRIVQYRQL